MKDINIWIEVPGGKELLASYKADSFYKAVLLYIDDHPSSEHELQFFKKEDGSNGYSISGSELFESN